MMRKPRSPAVALAATAIASGGLLALAIPASPALAFFSSPLLLDVRVQSPATLVSRGAAISVPVEVTCAGGRFASVDVTVVERVGSETARGSGFSDVTCDGHRRTIQITVFAQSDKAFRKGTGFAQANIFGCANSFCGNESDSRTISIVR
jgi:hypothetical protein